MNLPRVAIILSTPAKVLHGEGLQWSGAHRSALRSDHEGEPPPGHALWRAVPLDLSLLLTHCDAVTPCNLVGHY